MALARTPQDRQHDNPRSIISNPILKREDYMKGMEHNEIQAAEYIKRLVDGTFPKFEVTVSYSGSKSTESDGCSLLMVKKYWRNVRRASSSIINSPRSAL